MTFDYLPTKHPKALGRMCASKSLIVQHTKSHHKLGTVTSTIPLKHFDVDNVIKVAHDMLASSNWNTRKDVWQEILEEAQLEKDNRDGTRTKL